jgi:hypothetical protein
MAGQSEMDVLEKRIPKLLSRISDMRTSAVLLPIPFVERMTSSSLDLAERTFAFHRGTLACGASSHYRDHSA